MTKAQSHVNGVLPGEEGLSGKELRRQERFLAILEAAGEAFSTKGYHRSTMEDVALRAGVAVGTVYLYFPGKEALFVSLLDHLAQQLLGAVVEARSRVQGVLAKLGASIAQAVRVFAANRSQARIVLIEAVGASPAIDEKLASIHTLLAELVERDLREAVEEGLIPGQDLDISSKALVGTCYEVILGHLRDGRPASLEGSVPALLDLVFRAIGAANRRDPQ
ncbi:MAG: TetR/AcrR family transcriptional regulator [Firmicutes bacterium]|nr:TetR/AcrR family transcriptional regulator [Bacillota bacterium]